MVDGGRTDELGGTEGENAAIVGDEEVTTACRDAGDGDDGVVEVDGGQGADERGVIGLHQAGLPDELEGVPSMSVKFMGINEKAVAAYLMSLYF